MLADDAKFCYLAVVLRQTCGEYLLNPVRLPENFLKITLCTLSNARLFFKIVYFVLLCVNHCRVTD